MKMEMKVHSFPYGKQAYHITGGEDMGPRATKKYVKCDAPPSADYDRYNERRYMLPAQRGARAEGNRQLAESPDMSACMQPQSPNEAPCKGRFAGEGSPRFRPVQLFQDSPGAPPRVVPLSDPPPTPITPRAAPTTPAASPEGPAAGAATPPRARPAAAAGSAEGAHPAAAAVASATPPSPSSGRRPPLELPAGAG